MVVVVVMMVRVVLLLVLAWRMMEDVIVLWLLGGGWHGDGGEKRGNEVSEGGDVGTGDGTWLFEEREGAGFPGVKGCDC